MTTDGYRHDRPGTPAAEWRAWSEWADVPVLDLLGTERPERPEQVVVAAAHPDDESLGAGGLVSACRRAGIPVTLLLATAGERSHPRSPTTSAEALARRRLQEAERAWRALGGDPDHLEYAGLPDGGLTAHEDDLTNRLVAILGDARSTLLVTPWCEDGHPDHDALGRAGRRAAYRTGARLLQYPVWLWHRARPAEAPSGRMVRLLLDPVDRRAKAEAVAAHVTQVRPLSEMPGDEVMLGPAVLEHFEGDQETYVVVPPADPSLEDLHLEHDDPWGTETRWYEARKRDLLLAMLPRRRFARGLDVGCSTGTLTEVLAGRVDDLVAVDGSPSAVRAARRRLGDAVDVREMDVPVAWPEERFDLVVVSESGYFLSPARLDRLVRRIAESLASDGSLVLAHWRHPMVGWPLSGPDVHARFAEAAGIPPVVARYADRDVELVLHAAAGVLPAPAE